MAIAAPPSFRLDRLRLALAANAGFSAACGTALLFAGGDIAAALGALAAPLTTAIGAALVLFAAGVALVAVRPRVGWALVVSILDVLWVTATLPLTLVPGLWSAWGIVAVVAVAAVVAAFAAAQLTAVRAAMREPDGGPGCYRHCIRVATPAPADALWPVVADLGGIARYSPGLARADLRDATVAGVGAVRDCQANNGSHWSEEVTRFEPAARELDLRFLTEAPGFPFPVSAMTGGWRVMPEGGGSAVEVWWSFEPRHRLGWLLLGLMTIPLDRAAGRTVARMARAALGQPLDTPAPRPAVASC
jgi:hypothetical protein